MHFSHNDALIVTAYIRRCKLLKILVDGGSSVNVLYSHALDRMEDALELAQKLIIPQIQTLLYGFNMKEACSPGMAVFPVCTNPFNVITEFSFLDAPSPYNASLGRLWIHMMKAVQSIYHQLLKYPTPFELPT